MKAHQGDAIQTSGYGNIHALAKSNLSTSEEAGPTGQRAGTVGSFWPTVLEEPTLRFGFRGGECPIKTTAIK